MIALNWVIQEKKKNINSIQDKSNLPLLKGQSVLRDERTNSA